MKNGIAGSEEVGFGGFLDEGDEELFEGKRWEVDGAERMGSGDG